MSVKNRISAGPAVPVHGMQHPVYATRKFCHRCRLVVTDLSVMSGEERHDYLAVHYNDHVCMHYNEPGLRGLHWTSRMAARIRHIFFM